MASTADYTCRYTTTSHAFAERQGDMTNQNSAAAGLPGLETDVLGELRSDFLIGPQREGSIYAESGVKIQLANDWPQPAQLKVTYPWAVEGVLTVSTGFSLLGPWAGQSEARAEYLATAELMRGEIAVPPAELVSKVLNPDLDGGTDSHEIAEEGVTTRSVDTPASLIYKAFVRSKVTLMADGILGASALSRGEFANGDHGTKLSHLDWTFTIPSDFVIDDCGNGTLPF